jgi:hypothetical protein
MIWRPDVSDLARCDGIEEKTVDDAHALLLLPAHCSDALSLESQFRRGCSGTGPESIRLWMSQDFFVHPDDAGPADRTAEEATGDASHRDADCKIGRGCQRYLVEECHASVRAAFVVWDVAQVWWSPGNQVRKWTDRRTLRKRNGIVLRVGLAVKCFSGSEIYRGLTIFYLSAASQFSDGLSAPSITRMSTGALVVSSFNPS